MDKNEILYIIGDYCAQYEIEITDEQLLEAADCLAETIEYWEEYNERCGIHSVNVDILLDNYFDDFGEEKQ